MDLAVNREFGYFQLHLLVVRVKKKYIHRAILIQIKGRLIFLLSIYALISNNLRKKQWQLIIIITISLH